MEELDKALVYKVESYCSTAERCPADVEMKLKKWGADDALLASVMAHLYKERYLDDARFCRFFVRDKYRFNQWGRMKIVQALKMKHFCQADINAGLEEIDESEYADILRRLLQQKRKGIKAKSEYELNVKLMRFAVGRGFTTDEILRHIKEPDEYMD